MAPWIPPDPFVLERERISERIAERYRADRAAMARVPSPQPIVLCSSRDGQGRYEGYTLPATAQALQATAEAAGWGVQTTWATAILPPGFQRSDKSRPIAQAVMIDSVAIRLAAVRQAAWAVWTIGINDPPVACIRAPGVGIRSIGVKALIAYIKGEFDGQWI